MLAHSCTPIKCLHTLAHRSNACTPIRSNACTATFIHNVRIHVKLTAPTQTPNAPRPPPEQLSTPTNSTPAPRCSLRQPPSRRGPCQRWPRASPAPASASPTAGTEALGTAGRRPTRWQTPPSATPAG
eukprot:357068-Chlamydomonas_euryale.AAC.3